MNRRYELVGVRIIWNYVSLLIIGVIFGLYGAFAIYLEIKTGKSALGITSICLSMLIFLASIPYAIYRLARGREAIYATDKYLIIITYKSYQKIPLNEIGNVKANVGFLTTNPRSYYRNRDWYNSGQLILILKNSRVIEIEDVKDVLIVSERIGKIIALNDENNRY